MADTVISLESLFLEVGGVRITGFGEDAITIPAPGFSSDEISELVVKPMENKLMEIEGVEHTYGYSNRDFGSVMVTYHV